MNPRYNTSAHEQKAATAFSRQAAFFDALYSGNTIVQYKRERVREQVNQFLKPGSRILELNAGTGDDAIYFAQLGHSVHATDIATGMQERLAEKVQAAQLTEKVTQEVCSFTQLDQLKNKGPYDLIFSNFAGLNCTHELDKVLRSFSPLLDKDGIVTLVILPKFCLWEAFLLFKGKFKTAFRRFFSSKGRKAHIEGTFFQCWYYNPSYVMKHLEDSFDRVSLEGLCTIVPPSYIEGFAEKYPKLFTCLKRKENRLKRNWPWRLVGDYYIITLRKRGGDIC